MTHRRPHHHSPAHPRHLPGHRPPPPQSSPAAAASPRVPPLALPALQFCTKRPCTLLVPRNAERVNGQYKECVSLRACHACCYRQGSCSGSFLKIVDPCLDERLLPQPVWLHPSADGTCTIRGDLCCVSYASAERHTSVQAAVLFCCAHHENPRHVKFTAESRLIRIPQFWQCQECLLIRVSRGRIGNAIHLPRIRRLCSRHNPFNTIICVLQNAVQCALSRMSKKGRIRRAIRRQSGARDCTAQYAHSL